MFDSMNRILLLVTFLTIGLSASAVNAKKVWRTVVQQDGTSVDLMLCGNEDLHYYKTRDGLPVLRNENDSNYYYANAYGFGMTATTQMAHNAASRSAAESTFVSELSSTMDVTAVTETSTRKLSAVKRSSSVYNDSKKGLVILVQFSDNKFTVSDNAKSFYEDMLNTENYSSGKFIGSVHDYFYAQSAGKFDLTFDVVGPVTLSNNIAYYGANDHQGGNDARPGTMAGQACQLAADSVDFSDYDWDDDGYVDQVYIEYAGYGEADGGGSSTIWPHEWSLSSSDFRKSLTIDGKIVDTYACGNELAYGYATPTSSGIGTFCHEFSHCLGLPDFYDTSGGTNFGMDNWDLMDYGNYNGDGYCPAGYTSYEKWFCGWQDPTELTSACDVSNMGALSDGGATYVIYNDNNANEYYLLENRQQSGWDASLYGAGLLVLHVDYNASSWTNNSVNTSSSHQRLTIFHADNSAQSTRASLAGDPYPYGAKDSLTDSSRPAATLFNKNSAGTYYMDKPITNIVQNDDGTISFQFMGGAVSKTGEVAAVESVQTYDSLYGTAVDVYDANGKLMQRTNDFSGMDALPSGVYILRSAKGKVFKISK